MSDLFSLQKPFQPHCRQTTAAAGPMFWFILQKDTLYLEGNSQGFVVPFALEPPVDAEQIKYSRCIGVYDGVPCMVIELDPSAVVSSPLNGVTMRAAHGHIGSDHWTIAGRASQVLRWRRDHRFCGRCGSEMVEDKHDLLCRCPGCGYFNYPRLSPAVIMSVVRGDEILLGRSPHFPNGMYSVLAGYVEPGETLEEAVKREVYEETRIEVTDIRYINSQSWPFPHSLMVGFSARYASGELQPDGDELEDAAWFTPDNLPQLPSRISISRHLIELFLQSLAK
ncbi:NAD(+) diphosphatase [Desulfosediminicola sp.]|uniref:NAD(+) diphosphatase n=1 Tax=Desulfosediminicola sp. TaxID=2886825 RepID=UPI003AF2406A